MSIDTAGGQPSERPLGVAVIGAGLSGLICARSLSGHGHAVSVFDKARGVGGRMSTRRIADQSFDHGAQYFTVRDPLFARQVESWRQVGCVATWKGKITVLDAGGVRSKESNIERFVGVPGMNAICRHLAVDLDVTLETRVDSLEHVGDRWRLTSDGQSDLGSFDAVVISTPAPQAAELLLKAAPAVAARASQVEMAPCWAVMASFAKPLDLGFDGAFVHDSALSWVARNTSKPGRPQGEAWLLHASPDWSLAHLALDKKDVARQLLEAFGSAVGGFSAGPADLDAHRWRFALPTEPLTEPCLFDAGLRLGVCGDWCGGPRVEGAFLSGEAAAGRLQGS